MTVASTPLRRAGYAPALLGLVGLLLFGLLLEVLPRLGVLPAEYFPPTSEIARALVAEFDRPGFWQALTGTVSTWLIGLTIAVVAGIVLGVVIGSVPVLRAVTASTIEFLRPIPSVALLPLAIVLFSVPMRSILLLVIYASFWPVLIQVLHGVADVDPVARETAASYRLGRWMKARYLVWPTTLPYAMTGIRLSASVALVLTVTGELLIGGTKGIGVEINVAQSSIAVPSMYALIVVSGLIGLAANLLTRRAERIVLAWHPSVRRELPL
ncbi:ABC transporter permease [Paractinoplanes rishiriensis]|uniref:Nitrate ABC transporter permease n=1 Tax=Paractinoplanes rishiriensis TaxID=1050105 RepID=A0A919JX18_9ACTN|nr:ABC transporter permease [Actinoplanes rishiriensis]GIE96373.1 nitrate ABC transporter permease [Actinoplanes rishiriensis]